MKSKNLKSFVQNINDTKFGLESSAKPAMQPQKKRTQKRLPDFNFAKPLIFTAGIACIATIGYFAFRSHPEEKAEHAIITKTQNPKNAPKQEALIQNRHDQVDSLIQATSADFAEIKDGLNKTYHSAFQHFHHNLDETLSSIYATDSARRVLNERYAPAFNAEHQGLYLTMLNDSLFLTRVKYEKTDTLHAVRYNK